MRAFVIVLDSVGIGAAPDANIYGDAGANTLAHTAEAAGGLHVPTLQSYGLGNIPRLTGGSPIMGVQPTPRPRAGFGAMQELSVGKDTTTGHWEMAGLHLKKALHLFPAGPPSFPEEMLATLSERTGRSVIGNKAASGTKIIEELGAIHIETGAWIAYTSADSVFQIAAHEDLIPLEELYDACRIVRELCNQYAVGRVIARPFIGALGNFTRTENRRDFSYPLPEPSILSTLSQQDIEVITVGKLDDIFPDSGITESFHVENNADAAKAVIMLADRPSETTGSFIFANLIDFDSLYGHRRDPMGYAKALETTDTFLAELELKLRDDDLLIITADHGNDPTFKGTDHTREYVPLLVYSPRMQGTNLGIRNGFFDVAQSLAQWFQINPQSRGKSFLACNDSIRNS
jgi:phosphopentomutase